MGQFITCVFVLAVSLTLHAEIEFGSVIADGVQQQHQAASDIHQSIVAESPRIETTGVRMLAAAETAPEAGPAPIEQVVHRSADDKTGQDDKDFTVQLRPTGHAPAQRWFQVAYDVEQERKAKERAEKKLALKAKKEKLRQARLARAQHKLKKSSRAVASVKSAKSSRKIKGKTRKSVQTAQNSKSAN